MGFSIVPTKGTPLSVVVRTPSGASLSGVTLEAIGLRLEVSKANVANGRMDWIITDAEFDAVADYELKNKKTMPDGSALNPGECLINLKASMPGTSFGPQPAKGGAVAAGGVTYAYIRFVKGNDGFGPNTPVIMTLVDGCLVNFADNLHDDIPARNLELDEAREALITFHKQQVIRIIPEPVFDFAGGTCAAAPKSPGNQRCTAGIDCVDVAGTIDGVKFSTNLWGQKSKVVPGNFNDKIRHLELRNAVGLVRLVQRLKGAVSD